MGCLVEATDTLFQVSFAEGPIIEPVIDFDIADLKYGLFPGRGVSGLNALPQPVAIDLDPVEFDIEQFPVIGVKGLYTADAQGVFVHPVETPGDRGSVPLIGRIL